MLRPLVYALIIYFIFLALFAYSHVDRFLYWISVCALSTFFGVLIGNLFGGIHYRELQDDRY